MSPTSSKPLFGVDAAFGRSGVARVGGEAPEARDAAGERERRPGAALWRRSIGWRAARDQNRFRGRFFPTT
jgi:hypothetical protein